LVAPFQWSINARSGPATIDTRIVSPTSAPSLLTVAGRSFVYVKLLPMNST
jgi:hypothetical protein